jgi:RNA polymerase sigma factor (TIGR02999 family)
MRSKAIVSPTPSETTTRLLAQVRAGDSAALDQLLGLVYDELRRLAAWQMRAEREDHTLQPTALVHEAYLRLAGRPDPHWENRAHFFAVAAQVMRHVLVDHARARNAGKRAGAKTHVALDEALDVASGQDVDVIALHDAVERLAAVDPRLARVVEMRYFGGLTVPEVAEVTGMSRVTVEREWVTARAWLRKELS